MKEFASVHGVPGGLSRRSDARRNSERITAVALEVLARDPRASMEQVAAAAGVSRVTLYSHVGSRAELLKRALADHVELALAELRTCSLDSDARTVMADLTRCSWESVGSLEALRTGVLAEVGESAVAHAHEQVVKHIAAIIAAGQAAGSLTTAAEPGWLARCYFALVSQAAHENEASEQVLDGLVIAVFALLGVREGRLSPAPAQP